MTGFGIIMSLRPRTVPHAQIPPCRMMNEFKTNEY